MVQKHNFDKANDVRKRLINGEKLTKTDYKRLKLDDEANKVRASIKDAFIRNEV